MEYIDSDICIPNGAERIKFRPRSDWRDLTKEEDIAFRNTKGNRSTENALGLFRLNEDFIALLEILDLKDCVDQVGLQNKVTRFPSDFKLFKKHLIDLGTRLSSKTLLKPVFEVQSIFAGQPGKVTTAYNPIDKTYFGMHIDSPIYDGFYNLGGFENRLCINLGHEHRYLVFVNLTADHIRLLIQDNHNLQRDEINISSLTKSFFKQFPEYPILRLRQEPYEAYVAATSNLIHDGSVSGTNTPNITLVMTGCFDLLNYNPI